MQREAFPSVQWLNLSTSPQCCAQSSLESCTHYLKQAVQAPTPNPKVLQHSKELLWNEAALLAPVPSCKRSCSTVSLSLTHASENLGKGLLYNFLTQLQVFSLLL